MEKPRVSVIKIQEVSDLYSKYESVMLGDSFKVHTQATEIAQLLNKAKTLAQNYSSEQLISTDSLDVQQNESIINYMARLSSMIEGYESYSAVLQTKPDLLVRFFNHIPGLLKELA